MVDSQFAEECLKHHNTLRALHNSPDLVIDIKLNDFAQEWALVIAGKDSIQHREENDYGENLYVGYNSDPEWKLEPKVPVQSWYDEIAAYTFGEAKPENLADVGHFTQLVWKGSQKLGVGFARSESGKVYVVCNYEPAGNIVGEFPSNVAPKRPRHRAGRSECSRQQNKWLADIDRCNHCHCNPARGPLAPIRRPRFGWHWHFFFSGVSFAFAAPSSFFLRRVGERARILRPTGKAAAGAAAAAVAAPAGEPEAKESGARRRRGGRGHTAPSSHKRTDVSSRPPPPAGALFRARLFLDTTDRPPPPPLFYSRCFPRRRIVLFALSRGDGGHTERRRGGKKKRQKVRDTVYVHRGLIADTGVARTPRTRLGGRRPRRIGDVPRGRYSGVPSRSARLVAIPEEELRVWLVWLSKVSDTVLLEWQEWLLGNFDLALRLNERLSRARRQLLLEEQQQREAWKREICGTCDLPGRTPSRATSMKSAESRTMGPTDSAKIEKEKSIITYLDDTAKDNVSNDREVGVVDLEGSQREEEGEPKEEDTKSAATTREPAEESGKSAVTIRAPEAQSTKSAAGSSRRVESSKVGASGDENDEALDGEPLEEEDREDEDEEEEMPIIAIPGNRDQMIRFLKEFKRQAKRYQLLYQYWQSLADRVMEEIVKKSETEATADGSNEQIPHFFYLSEEVDIDIESDEEDSIHPEDARERIYWKSINLFFNLNDPNEKIRSMELSKGSVSSRATTKSKMKK